MQTRGGSRFIQLIPTWFLSFSLVLTGCASKSNREVSSSTVNFSTIAIASPKDIVAVEGAETRSQRAKKGVVYGATGGAAAGTAAGAIACAGPWAGLCIAVGAAMGYFAGGATGALYGFTGVSEDDSHYIIEEMTFLSQSRNFQSELAGNLKSLLPKDVLSLPETADVQAVIGLKSIEFIENDNDFVYMRMSASLFYIVMSDHNRSKYRPIEFNARSSEKSLSVWLEAGSEHFDKAATECIQKISEKMARRILEARSFSHQENNDREHERGGQV